MHTAGLKVVVPSTPSDAYWLLRHSIAEPGSGDLPGAQAAVLGARGRRHHRARRAHRPRGGPPRRATTSRCSPTARWSPTALSAADWPPTPTGPGGRRPALAQPARLRHRGGVGAQDRRAVVMHEGPRTLGLRRRAGGPHPGGAVLRPGGAGVARHRIRHPVSACAAGEALAAGRRPAARLRREGDEPAMTGDVVRDFLVPDLGEGLEDATITAGGRGRRRRRAQPDAVHGGDQQGRGGDPQPVCGPHRRTRWRRRRDARRRRGAGAHRDRCSRSRTAPGRVRNGRRASRCWSATAPTTTMDTSRRAPADGTGRAPSHRCASWPPTCTSTWLALRRVRVRTESSPARTCWRAAGRSAPDGRHGRRARCAGRDGAANDVVAQARFPTRTPVFRSTARRCCRCATGCARRPARTPPITPFVLTLRLLTIALTPSSDAQLDVGGHRRTARRSTSTPPCTWGSAWRRRAGCWCRWSRMRTDKTTRELAADGGAADRRGAGGHAQTG